MTFNEEEFIERTEEKFNQVAVVKKNIHVKDEFLFRCMEKTVSKVERI